MVTDEQIKKANDTAKIAFEATKMIYDLAIIAWELMTSLYFDYSEVVFPLYLKIKSIALNNSLIIHANNLNLK